MVCCGFVVWGVRVRVRRIVRIFTCHEGSGMVRIGVGDSVSVVVWIGVRARVRRGVRGEG